MINQKAEIESQDMIEAEESVSNRGKFESKKKMKKVRSMKLQRLSSRGRKSQHDQKFSVLSSVGTVEMADASPNYMKGTSSSSSHAKDGFQNEERGTTNKSLTRVTTLKVKRSLTRKLSGKTEQKRKLKPSRSVKLATVKGPKSTMLYSDSESINGSDGKNRDTTSDAGSKSQRVITRRLSLKTVRISSKKPSLHKATCSSTIKDSHFSDQIDLPQEGSSSQGVSAIRVCPYTYCSLHGHHHGDVPPLKRFVSMRRRQLKTQKSVKKDGRSKQIGNARKATQKIKTVQSEDGNSHIKNVKNLPTESSPLKPHDTPPSTVNEGDTSTKDKNMEPDYEVLQKSFAQEEPKPGSTTSVSYGVQERDQKYIKKWHLMYKHAVLSNTGKYENKVPFVEKDIKGTKEEDDLAFNGGNNSSHNCSETDSDMDDEKKNVIELVQKAFDEILLPEVEDLSSDDHSKLRGNATDKVLLEKSEGKIEERNATTFAESPKELQKMESKPKSWSHLKKVILLKRFVKALEKVRNINPKRPRQLPSDANFEAEKVLLNRQTAEERKKSEEWMLDYALQKVISKLAPSQRQKVTLLIDAFETIRPFQDAENVPRSNATAESQGNPIQTLDASSNHSKEEINHGRDCEVTERARNDENMTACEKNDENATVESTSTDVVKFPVFNVEILEDEVTTKGENMEPEPDHKVTQKIFVQEEPKHVSSTTTGVPEGDQKYIKKWHLMYKHAVLSNTGKFKNELLFVEKDKEGREEDDVTFNGGKSSSCLDYSETDSDMDDEKKNVIELVQKAFDEILLPEAEDLSSNDHSKSRGNETDEVPLDKSEGKIEERNATTFAESPKEVQKMESKPKSWSHLKKVILLKRFVKALDKVRNINPRKPRQLASDANFEAEKVFLNRQTSEERKKSEEWMLDYALQKVISKLAPAQRQKVTLLIEAFETIRPFQDAETGPRSTATVESQENPIQSLDASSNHSKEEINDGRDFEVTVRARSDKNMTVCNKNDESAAVESSTDVVKFPVFNVGILEEGVTTKGENMEPDHKVPQKISVQEEPKHGSSSSSTTGVPYGLQEGDQKYIKKWHLMYKHAVLSNTGKCENVPPFGGKDNEGREEDDITFNEGKSSCHNYSETDSDMDDEKKNVIELVQKAFDEILLPEAEDLSFDDHSKSRSYGSEDALLEKIEGKEERNTTTFTESTKEAQKMENKPKSWSYLKKVILLKRFVKALDKVRNINPRRPRQLPSDANFEAEKVFLNRQTAEERKKSEEWMLDYALQKVISKLAPAQRQRVRLLIEAFETIRPFQDAENGPRSSVTVESQENPVQLLDAASNHRKEEVNDERDSVYLAKSLLGKVSCSNDSTMKFSDKSSDNSMHELCNPIKPVESVSSCHEDAPTNGIVEEVPEDLVSDLNAENPSIKSESPGKYCETKNVIGDNSEQFSLTKSLILNGLVRSLKANLVVPEAPSNQLDEPTGGRKDMIEKDQLETSEAPASAVVESETQVEKQGNTGLWFMVYKHMVSDMTENNSKTLTDVADEKESKSEGSITRENSVSDESTPVINQDMHLEDRNVELRQIEAIKMVEEAIDSILPDRQPLTDNNTIDRTERMYSGGLNQKEEKTESGNGIAVEQKEETVSKEGNKPSQKLSRNWSNLRKVVLLKRFIKALEKVRKFNPRGPRYLPLEADSEDEKVQLRYQDMAERKGTEEWMLDYALRQVVSKLTPARKRKVELLVEAFETVKK